VDQAALVMAKASELSLRGYKNCRDCPICGQRIVLTGPRALWFITDEHGARAYHFDCYQARQRPDARQALQELLAADQTVHYPDCECAWCGCVRRAREALHA
jgi:hypothetical protein